MNRNQAHYRLIEIAAELARCQALRPLDCIEDWPGKSIGRARVLQMIERTEDALKRLALDVRDMADVQAREISRLRQAIEKVVRESHVPSTGIVALSNVVPAESVACWRTNYGLDKRTPGDASRWWSDAHNGMAPAGAVAALGTVLDALEQKDHT